MSVTYPLVSIILLNYNGKDCLEDCINSVLKTQYGNFEILLVDNASTDGSIERAQVLFGGEPRLTILRSEVNLAFSGGNNLGFNNSRGKYIVFLNNDTVVDPNWLKPLVDTMENDRTIGVAQSLILNIDGKTIQNGGWLFSNHLIRKYPLCAGQPSTLEFEPVYEVSFVCGACMMVRRSVLDTMGAFDPGAPFFYDDTLLSLKTRLLDKRAIVVSSSRIRHISGATKVWKLRFTTRHLFESNILLLFDIYYGKKDLAKALLINLLHFISLSLFSVKEKNTAAVTGEVEALSWSLRNVRFLWRNRLNHWSKTKIPPGLLKETFIRVKIPSAFFLFPSRLGDEYYKQEIRKFERKISR